MLMSFGLNKRIIDEQKGYLYLEIDAPIKYFKAY